MGRSSPEVTSLNDRVTMVSYKCPIHVSGLLCTVHELHATFSEVKTWRFVNFAARRRARAEVTLLIGSSTTVSY
jgi:hypothetical protein